MQTFLFVSSALIAVIAFCLAFSNVFSRPRTRANLVYSGFFGSAALWASLYAVWQTATSEETARFWCQWLMVPAGFIGPFFFHWHMLCDRSGIRRVNRVIRTSLYVAATLHAVLSVTTATVVADMEPMFGVPYWPIAGWGFGLFLATYVVGFVWPCLRSLPTDTQLLSRTVGGRHRIAGSLYVVASFCGATNIPGWFHIEIPPVGQPFLIPYLLMTAYAGARRPGNVIAVDHVGAIVWTVALMSVAALAGTLVRPLGARFEITTAIVLGAFVSASAVALLFPKLKWIIAQLHRVFGDKARDAAHRLKELGATLHLLPTPELRDRLATLISAATSCRRVAVYWRKGPDPLRLLTAVGERRENRWPDHLADDELVVIRSAIEQEPWVTAELPLRGDWLAGCDVCAPVLEGGRIELLLFIGAKARDSGYSEAEISALHTIAVNLHHTLTARAISEHEAGQRQLIYTGKVAAGFAHNIRNPLAAVRAYLEADPTLERDSRDALHQVALSEIARIQGTVDGLSALSRGERFALERHDLFELADYTRTLQQEYLESCGAQLVLKFAPRQYFVLADRPQLVAALSNLVRNAAEEIASAGETGWIAFSAAAENNDQVTLRIKDSGRGLPASIEQAVFSQDLFSKTTKEHSAPSRRTGFGIGLHSTMLIVTIGHGGRFEYRDGAFVITLLAAPASTPGRE